MAILSVSPVRVGQGGFQPNVYKMVTTDSLAAITTVNYFQQYTAGAFFVNNDIIETIYLYGTLTPLNTLLRASVNINTGVVTFSVQSSSPLGTASTKAASNNFSSTVASIALAPNAPVVGSVASFNDSAGTIGHTAGDFTAKKIAIPGGTISYGVFDVSCTADSILLGVSIAAANLSHIVDIAPGFQNFTVTYNTDPGVGQFGYLILNPQ